MYKLWIAQTRIIHDAFVIAAIRCLLRLARRQLTTARINCHDLRPTGSTELPSLSCWGASIQPPRHSIYRLHSLQFACNSPYKLLLFAPVVICYDHQLPQIQWLTNLPPTRKNSSLQGITDTSQLRSTWIHLLSDPNPNLLSLSISISPYSVRWRPSRLHGQRISSSRHVRPTCRTPSAGTARTAASPFATHEPRCSSGRGRRCGHARIPFGTWKRPQPRLARRQPRDGLNTRGPQTW